MDFRATRRIYANNGGNPWHELISRTQYLNSESITSSQVWFPLLA
jgi:hypothetical protein